KLHGCNYDWNEDAFTLFTKGVDTICSAHPDASAEKTEALRQSEREKRKKNLARPQVGVIAQDVEAVLPEAVTTDEEGYKSVHYHQLIPLLIEAIKEQDLAVTAQAELLARQQREIERLTRDIDRLMQVVAVSV
ncbi:MAG TPA: tail fiber domain-containing protein, partial [Pyrinomonadaceae bacterium]|nr:tail fiber domain-containing protein [Pyrinomonadaceae bacterium]